MEEDPRKMLRPVSDDEVVRLAPEDEVLVLVPEEVVKRAEALRRLEIERLEVESRPMRAVDPGVETLLADVPAVAEDPEKAWKGVRRRVPYGWFVLIFLALLGAALWSLAAAGRDEAAGEEVAGPAAILERVEQDRAEELEAMALVDRLERTARGFIEAKTVEEMAKWVRDPEVVRPMMENWYATREWEPKSLRSVAAMDALDFDGRKFWVVELDLRRGGMPPVLMEERDDGSVRVDWESLVVYQPMPWDEFVSARPEGRALEFRVQAAVDALYSHEWADESQWQVYRLSPRESDDFVFGYVRRDSEAGRMMAERVVPGSDFPAAVLLKLSVPPGTTSPRGVLIEEVVSPRWVVLDRGGSR